MLKGYTLKLLQMSKKSGGGWQVNKLAEVRKRQEKT